MTRPAYNPDHVDEIRALRVALKAVLLSVGTPICVSADAQALAADHRFTLRTAPAQGGTWYRIDPEEANDVSA